MKTIKLLVLTLFLGVMCLAAATAQAYTIYNQTGYKACIIDAAHPTFCAINIEPGGTFKSERGDPQYLWFNYNTKPGVCYLSQKILTVPESGSAKMYTDHVDVFNSSGEKRDSAQIARQTCSERQEK